MAYIDSICAKWLYRLNNNTSQFIEQFNAIYNISTTQPYIALQIRNKDKKFEMDPHQCNLLLLHII